MQHTPFHPNAAHTLAFIIQHTPLPYEAHVTAEQQQVPLVGRALLKKEPCFLGLQSPTLYKRALPLTGSPTIYKRALLFTHTRHTHVW